MVTEFFINDVDLEIDVSKLDINKYSEYETEIYKPKERKELLSKGDKAPDFELVNHEGKTVSLQDYRGKVVLIDFWGTWCVWCVRSFPKLEEAYTKLKDKNVEFLGLSCQEPDDAEPVKFAREKGISYPILLDGDAVSEEYNVSGFPTFYIIDKEGNVILAKSGYSDELDKIIIDSVTPYL
jgi:peroxiredoxin